MHHHLRTLSLAAATLMLAATSPLLPLTSNFKPPVVQAQTTQDRKAEADRLFQQGGEQVSNRQYEAAIPFYQQALKIYQEIRDRQGEAYTLNDLAVAYRRLKQYQRAIELYQQSLAIKRELRDRRGEANSLMNIHNVYKDLNQYGKAIEFGEQGLAIFQELGERDRQAHALTGLGTLYRRLGNYEQAIRYHQRSLAIYRELKDRAGEATVLGNLGNVYLNLGGTNTGIKAEKHGFVISNQDITFGYYNKAIEYHQQSLAISRKIGDRQNEAISLGALGTVYLARIMSISVVDDNGQILPPSITMSTSSQDGSTFQTSITLSRSQSDSNFQENLTKAIDYFQQYLTITREIGNRFGESVALHRLGVAYKRAGDYRKALEFHQQSLAIARELNNRDNEATYLSNIASVLVQQNRPELAIIFYKQSINITEEIRKDLRVLPSDQQRLYTKKIAGSYRALADLLLQQDRVLEAQEVLDLLKLQELEDYLRNVRGNLQIDQKLDFWQPEQQILKLYHQWIGQNPKSQFEAFVNSPDVTALVGQLRRTARGQNLNPEQLTRLQDNLQSLDKAALLYPLILDDRIELVLVTPTSLVRKTVAVKRVQLNQAIRNFLSDITDPRSNPTPNAQQLYQWLIQPIADDLERAQVKTILYAADSQLRYIPLAALHDGKQYLIQRFTLNHITAASLTKFNRNATRSLQILAAAYSDPQLNYQFQIGEDQFNFNGLKYAGVEVETLTKEFPGTTTFFNKDFSRDNVEPHLGKQSIVHLATHAEFVSKSPHESFILFGSGERVTLADINKWKLPDVDLVVLSACQTATSGGTGEEILGFGYQIQRTGAEAAIASLWSVNDGGTQALMNAFYAILKKGNITKAEALRQAQIALITKDLSAVGLPRGNEAWIEVVSTRTGLPAQVSNNLNHPYYWAPFILIGNGL
jgi:CHAT domain-containing protein